ncbi:MAG: putative lipid II flippase FtsW [bacterium]|nr:putative lipid II flippase FtsW [bacterium]
MKKRHPVPLRYQTGGIDRQLAVAVTALIVFGVVMVFNTSIVDAARTFGDQFYFGKRQLLWAGIGFLGMIVLSKTPYPLFAKLALPFFLLTTVLLILALIPGFGASALGATRRINIGPFGFQPAELAKLSMVVFLATILSKRKHPAYFLISVALVLLLVILEPDLGTTGIIGAIAILVYFASGAPIWHFILLIPVALAGVATLALSSSYRKERVLTFFNPDIDPLGTSYHIRQILIALGSGGIFGVGLGQSRQKYLFLPEPMTDSIFAIIGEELGLLGTVGVLGVFVFLIWRGFLIARRTPDPFGRLLAVGITSWIGVQAFVNLAAMVALLPLTGVPLPFVSYGGSSLVVGLLGIGILLSISRQKRSLTSYQRNEI